MKILAVMNSKGGVGKTTTALALGAGLTLKGFKILFIDLDAQGNMTYTLGADNTGLTGPNSFDVLTGKTTATGAIRKTEQGAVIASSPALAGADITIIETGKEYKLREAIEPLEIVYDYIIIDTPPALGILTINALTACNGVLIPAQADIYSLQGISQLYSTFTTVQRYCNPKLRIMGIVLTRYNGRAIIAREVAEQVEETAKKLETKLYNSKIRETTSVKEAQARRQNIFEYSPKSNATEDYTALVDEILLDKEV